jgi:hypothetical protein
MTSTFLRAAMRMVLAPKRIKQEVLAFWIVDFGHYKNLNAPLFCLFATKKNDLAIKKCPVKSKNIAYLYINLVLLEPLLMLFSHICNALCSSCRHRLDVLFSCCCACSLVIASNYGQGWGQ